MQEKSPCTLPPASLHSGSTEKCTALVAGAGAGFEAGVAGEAAAAPPRFLLSAFFGLGVAGATTAQQDHLAIGAPCTKQSGAAVTTL